MTCPCCGKEMEPGYIKSPQQISWSRNTEMGYEPVGEGKIQLSQNFWNGFFNGFHVKSFYCANCKQILTPVK